MIVQACLNGARAAGYHPRLPIQISELVEDAVDCVNAGAAEVHFHVHAETGNESLDSAPVAATIQAIRRALPGTLIGISKGDWIEGDDERRLALISRWHVLPDHASVNLVEPGAGSVIQLLLNRGVCVEAGCASVIDVQRLIDSGLFDHVLRVLVEVESSTVDQAVSDAEEIMALLDAQASRKPVLLHGFDDTVWPLIRLAAERRLSTRVGLEDGCHKPDGELAGSNADLVRAALGITKDGKSYETSD